jgi:1-deoxy-D-xylulose-5-phosphate reductoisomerase
MRLPIQYALTYPERIPGPSNRLRATDLVRLDFEEPDLEAFPLLALARQAGMSGATYPTVLSAADTVAVEAFLAGRIAFVDITNVVSAVLDAHQPASGPLTLDAIAEADRWAEHAATAEITQRSRRE